ncbi:MAG: hypothetical protein NTZ33_03490 [Bacteroidetes bacterium]|nr:hypothetical protein [Bacteroidota bacterium]
MKRCLLMIFVGLFFFQLNAQDSLWFRCWTGGTAFTMPKHRIEMNFFDESAYGLTNSIEISSNLPMGLLMPQFSIKKYWLNVQGLSIASKHGIFYPSPFLRTVAREGIGGLISPEFDIPQMIAISNQIILSYSPFKKSIFSGFAGFKFALKSSTLDERTTIDLPYIYPRLAVFYSQPEIDAGIDFRGSIIKWMGWQFNTTTFLFMNTTENYFQETNLSLTYTSKKQKFKFIGGSKLCYGKYVPGPQWHLLPMFSFAFKL